MALAYLFSCLLKMCRGINMADNPVSGAFGLIVDHQLRPGSSQEAARVSAELRKLGLKALVMPLDWRDVRERGMDPAQLPNLEGLARSMRYRKLGSACRRLHVNSLFFAHHRDDQYETVLMRLLAGHGYRGLQGIREANAIPECYDMHGVYKSGLLDDQLRRHPYLSLKPSNRELRRLRRVLGCGSSEPAHHIEAHLGINDTSAHFAGRMARDTEPRVPYLPPLKCEDGGVTIHRPLLEFDKGRLIATCEANNVPWFEDHTNVDPTLTTRNAVRHMTATRQLPKALQKPAILALSKRAKRRTQYEEAAAHRLLMREAVIREFSPNVGTLLVELPPLGANRAKRRRLFAAARDEAHRRQRRLIAAMAIRKLVDFVTPALHSPPPVNLENVVDRLFPGFSDPGAEPSKAFSIAGIVFTPIAGPALTQWLLFRAPYPSSRPLPVLELQGHHCRGCMSGDDGLEEPVRRHAHWRGWSAAKLWDGRFWVRVSACVPARFRVLPLQPRHSKPFRLALPEKQQVQLEKVLKHYAPGKVRYSLPAIYSVEGAEADPATWTLTLLALPSLGVHVPGLDRWLKYETRYKKVDGTLLGLTRRGSAGPAFGHGRCSSAPRRRRARRTAKCRATRGM